MMIFDFFNVPRIVFGCGRLAALRDIVPASARPLLVYNGSDALAERIAAALPANPARFRQRGEPTVADVDRALAAARDGGCDFVLGAGGGSAIDAAKAVAGLLANGGAVTDYMEVVGKGQKITKPATPWIAIPATAGTGAEVTRNAVVGWPEKKFKASLRSELLVAKVALIDPELGVDVPPAVTAASGMDALCQCVEAYVSTGASELSSAVAMDGVSFAIKYLKRAFENGRDVEARQGMAYAALCGGIALTNAGLGAVHGFAAPLGSNFPVPHGVVCGALLPHVVRANLEHGDSALRIRYGHLDPLAGPYAGIAAACDALVRDLRIPGLKQFGVTEADVEPMVALAKRASSMRYNPVTLGDETLAQILTAAL